MRVCTGVVALAVIARLAVAGGAGAGTGGEVQSGGAGGGYEIKFDRATAVGNVYEIHWVYDMTAVETLVAPTHDPVTRKIPKHVDLTGRVVIKGVNERGQATNLVLTVIKMTRLDGRDMIRPGSVIRIALGEENRAVDCSTGPVPDAAWEIINRFIPARGKNDKSNDDIFGSAMPRRAGESWPINQDAAAEKLTGLGIALDGEVKGKTTVNGLRVDGLMVTTELRLPNVTLPIALPAGVKLDLCSATGVTQWLLPVDPRAEVSDLTLTLDSMASGHGTETMVGLEVKAHEVIVEHSAIVGRGKRPMEVRTANGG